MENSENLVKVQNTIWHIQKCIADKSTIKEDLLRLLKKPRGKGKLSINLNIRSHFDETGGKYLSFNITGRGEVESKVIAGKNE